MNRIKRDREYYSIIEPILNNNEFDKLNNIKHHNTTRMDHSLKVSYYSYKISKAFNLDYVETARGGLLHDFYLEKIKDTKKIKDKVLLYSTEHPKHAVENSKVQFGLTDKEEDIIKSHMFPAGYNIPKYAESWVVSTVDKVLSFKEFGLKFSHKLSYVSNFYLLVLLNFIK